MQYPYNNLENFTLPSLLNRSVKLYGDKAFSAIVGDQAINYSEFMQKIEHAVYLLQSNGVSKGDKVVLLSENMPNWAVAYFAITYFGAVVVPVLTDFHKSDIHTIIDHCDAKAIFVSDKHLTTIKEYENSNEKLIININRLEPIKELSNSKYLNETLQNPINEKVDENDLATIIYTSGTTGNSKGVMLSHKNLVTNALSSHAKVKVLTSDIFLSILPLAHTLECTVGLIIPILHGSSIYYVEKPPTTTVLLEAFKVIKPTMIITVPLIIEKIYKKRVFEKIDNCVIRKNLYKVPFARKVINRIAGRKILEAFGGKIRFFAIGGAPLSSIVEEFLIEAKFPYIVGYGLTETAPLIAGSILNKKPRLSSTGTLFPGVEIKIKNKDIESGEGEICVKSPSLMMGYYKDEEKTAEVMEDGWLLTGDIGHIDNDGFIYISGRSKNVIIGPNAENIYPEQIESIINSHGAVIDSLVTHKDGKIIAMVQLDYETCNIYDNQNIDKFLENMRKGINSQLASYSKIMKFVEQKGDFIKTPTKKIKRYMYEN